MLKLALWVGVLGMTEGPRQNLWKQCLKRNLTVEDLEEHLGEGRRMCSQSPVGVRDTL